MLCMYFGNSNMQDDNRKSQLFQLFNHISGKTKIVEPMKKIHGTLRDREAVEREIALVMREILEQGLFKTKLKPIQLAKLVSAYYAGKNDTEIARELGDEKLSKTVPGHGCGSNSSGISISGCLLTGRRWRNCWNPD